MESLLQTVDLVRSDVMRREDLAQRAYENWRRKVQDQKRAVDMKTSQLRAIGELAALLCGFSIIVLTQLNIPEPDNPEMKWKIALFGATTTLVAVLNMVTLIFSALVMVPVLGFDTEGHVPFNDFWTLRCQKDWGYAFQCFVWGVTFFIVNLAICAWVEFHQSPTTAWICTVITGCILLVWLLYLRPSWGGTNRSWAAFAHNKYMQPEFLASNAPAEVQLETKSAPSSP